MFLHEASQPATLLWGRAIPVRVDFWHSVWKSQQMCKELTMVLESLLSVFMPWAGLGQSHGLWKLAPMHNASHYPDVRHREAHEGQCAFVATTNATSHKKLMVGDGNW